MTTAAPSGESYNQRIVVLPPSPHDAHVCRSVLDEAQIDSIFCDTLDAFCLAIEEGAGTALIAEEYLSEDGLERLRQCLRQQPPWSELPLLILLSTEEYSSTAVQRMLSLEHVTFLSRPLRIAIFVNKVHAKLRERQRQYAIRDLLIEQERNREVLHDEAQRLKMALSAGGMAAWHWTNERSIWDDALFLLLGVEPIENPSSEFFFQCVHPDDLPGLKATWKRATQGMDRYRTEFRIIRPDGHIRWLAGVGEVIRDSDHRVIGMHGLNWDVTDRIEAEQRIRSSEERLRLALGAAELQLWQWDVTTDKVYRSGEGQNSSGLVPVHAMGNLQDFLDFVHPSDRSRVRETLFDCLRTGSPYRCEYRIRRASKSHRWVMAMGHLSVQDTESGSETDWRGTGHYRTAGERGDDSPE